jgi:AbrB family looped-hinge helix DNA binding protein
LPETRIDSKGRVVIPKEVRKELGLTGGSRVRISVAEDNSIVVKSGVNPQEFIKQTEGLLKRGSRAKAADPLRLKEVWVGL